MNSSNDGGNFELLDMMKDLCFELNNSLEHPYEVFCWQSLEPDRISIKNFLMITDHLKKISIEECISENIDIFIRQILQKRFEHTIIEQYIKERYLLLENFCEYFGNVSFYKLEASSNYKDIRWIATAKSEKEKHVVLIVDLLIVLDHFNTKIKPIQADCSLWHEYLPRNYSKQVNFFSELSKHFDIVSLVFYELPTNLELIRDEFIEQVLKHNIGINTIPSEKQLLDIDEIERNRISIQYMDIDGEEVMIETNGEDGYIVEIADIEYEIDLQNISEEGRLSELKRQVYSHIYIFKDFCHDAWNRVLYKNQSHDLTSLEESANKIYKLINLFVSSLESIRIYSIGDDLYLVGKSEDRNWIGIHHTINKSSLENDEQIL